MTYRNAMLWRSTERDAQIAAGQKLQTAVSALTRAKRLQHFAEYILGGLFWGLAAACAAVLILRLGALSGPVPIFAFSFICAALIVAAAIAWRRRPDDLQVAILADVQLNLKQKLSTAWEFARSGADSVLSERLAVQAIQSRLPARPERVFPLRLNIWGRLTPVAAVLLLLLVILDFQPAVAPTMAAIDAVVASQGRQLREYGRRMEVRSQRDGLSRSGKKSQDIQRLGSRMESGALSREQALRRLRELGTALDEQRQAALSEGARIKLDPQQVDTVAVQSALQASSLLTKLEELAQGLLAASDIQLSESDTKTLSRLGISQQELESALQRLAEGDAQDIRRIAETLSRAGQALRESEELAGAQRKIERVRENLGDDAFGAGGGDGQGEKTWTGNAQGESGPGLGDPHGDAFGAEGGGSMPGPGAGDNRQETSGQSVPFDPQSQSGGVVLKPESQLLEGAVYTSEVRVMPRLGKPALETVELATEFSAQVEEALSKEEYPLHHKEFIRRYFLTLSDGVLRETAAETEE